jgi:hypothetical protein
MAGVSDVPLNPLVKHHFQFLIGDIIGIMEDKRDLAIIHLGI